VLIATRKNDDGEKQRVAEMCTKQYGRRFDREDIDCDGCLTNGQRIFGYCDICGIRRCARGEKVENCAFCLAYPCEKLSELFAAYSKARETLDEIRRQYGKT
jgi:hypothetical protein